MPIELQWKHQYKILNDFIASNPEIQIGRCEVCIPVDSRDRFYACFDSTRRAIVESWNNSSGFDAYALSKMFVESESKLSELFNLTVKLPVDLSSFLRNPREGMMRLIYNRLFELIQRKISEDDFERIAKDDLASEAIQLFRMGYETWVALTLIILLEPDGFWGIALDAESQPLAADISEISFGCQFHSPAKRMPEFILHSRKLDSYIAFKMPLVREVNAYAVPVEIPTQRLLRNRNGDTSSILGHRMIFLSVVPDLKKIPVFADIHERKIDGPDLTIEFVTQQELTDAGLIGQVQSRLDVMKPHRQGKLVLIDPKPESGIFGISENIEVVSVGLDRSKLQRILENLA